MDYLPLKISEINILKRNGGVGALFLARLDKVQKSYCTTRGVGGVSKMLKFFYVKVFYVMGKAL